MGGADQPCLLLREVTRPGKAGQVLAWCTATSWSHRLLVWWRSTATPFEGYRQPDGFPVGATDVQPVMGGRFDLRAGAVVADLEDHAGAARLPQYVLNAVQTAGEHVADRSR